MPNNPTCWKPYPPKPNEPTECGVFAGRRSTPDPRQVTCPACLKRVEEERTDVIFRWCPDEGTGGRPGECLAIFPGLAATRNPDVCTIFVHVGQHGTATAGLGGMRDRAATPAEYADLKKELESAPYYYILRVVKRFTRKHRAARLAQINYTPSIPSK